MFNVLAMCAVTVLDALAVCALSVLLCPLNAHSASVVALGGCLVLFLLHA